ncbi:MAG: hypothetical protein WAU56_12380 [Steroidobacteraceae bacterium]
MAAAPGYDGFCALVHQRFTVDGPAGEVVLELESAEAAGQAGRPSGFRLLFRGPQATPLPQGTYAFRHPRCSTGIFIVPIGLDPAGYRYEAIFNP